MERRHWTIVSTERYFLKRKLLPPPSRESKSESFNSLPTQLSLPACMYLALIVVVMVTFACVYPSGHNSCDAVYGLSTTFGSWNGFDVNYCHCVLFQLYLWWCWLLSVCTILAILVVRLTLSLCTLPNVLVVIMNIVLCILPPILLVMMNITFVYPYSYNGCDVYCCLCVPFQVWRLWWWLLSFCTL